MMTIAKIMRIVDTVKYVPTGASGTGVGEGEVEGVSPTFMEVTADDGQ